MNGFCEKVMSVGGGPLRASDIEVLQVNLGLRCNQECVHCHVSASPMRTEAIDWRTMKDVLDAARLARPALVDLTGGAPELNPHFREFVKALREEGHAVQVRTNLTVMTEPGLEGMPGFLRENGVLLVASMPCYLSENVCAQRGAGSYDKSVQVLRTLNSLGYGREDGLQLNLVYNPGGAFLPPGQPGLEADYRRELPDVPDWFEVDRTDLTARLGEIAARRRTSASRSGSRPRASTWARRWCARVTGWARCRWV